MTMRKLAELIGVSHATVSRWFNGIAVPDVDQVSAVLTHLGVNGDERTKILNLAIRAAAAPADIAETNNSPAQFKELLTLERTAHTVVEWSPLLVPELLRTANYGRATVAGEAPTLKDAEVDHLTTLMLGRQNAITREDPVRLTAFVGVAAVISRIGGQATMAGQLRYLLTASRLEAVTVRLVPIETDWHGGLLGPFSIYERGELPTVIRIKRYHDTAFAHDPNVAQEYRKIAKELGSIAMSPDQSRDCLNTVINEL
ncbi:helix-turn-helix domain-containing protein [Amycolatopsis pigmentata]|uniref:Helix-turn-helix transcriptional regulator n=1 Tax=Amycolatopsis pigmentata TaxID=450801 RepID=A0ABW5FK53_9PSEU